MTAELNARGHTCSENTVARLMRDHGIRATAPRRLVMSSVCGGLGEWGVGLAVQPGPPLVSETNQGVRGPIFDFTGARPFPAEKMSSAMPAT